MDVGHLPLFASNVFYLKADHIDVEPIKKIDSGFVKAAQYTGEDVGVIDTSRPNYRVLDSIPETKEALLEIFKRINYDLLRYDNDWAISTSWLTVTEKGCDGQLHNHRNCFYSGIFYFDHYEEEGMSSLEIMTPLQYHGGYQLKRLNDEFGPPITVADQWEIPPEHKKLILFPSYLIHKIGKQKADKPRYSLAFNIVPIAPYGVADSQALDLSK